MTNEGALMVLLAVLGGVLGLYLTFTPSKRPGRSPWRRFVGVVLTLCAVGGGFLMVAGAGLAQVANH